MPSLNDDLDAVARRVERRLAVLLPPAYRETYRDVQPVSMGSAPLRLGPDGLVAWDRMWATFCDLAMAGGPPHKGRWLAPGSASEVEADPERYDDVVQEIRRGLGLVTGLDIRPSSDPGWVPVVCFGEAMAGWLTRAIVMENVAVRRRRAAIDLPAAPHFRVEREIKNVVTVLAKTCHYWVDHMPYSQQAEITALLWAMDREAPLVMPPSDLDAAWTTGVADAAAIGEQITRLTGLATALASVPGWLGVGCASVERAVWLMRALVTENIGARREDTTVFVAVNPATDPEGQRVVSAVGTLHRLAVAAGGAIP